MQSAYSAGDLAMKVEEDAFRALCIGGDPSASAVGEALLVRTGDLLGVERVADDAYPPKAHVWGLHPASDQGYFGRPASVGSMEAFLARVPASLRGLSAVPGIAVCGGYASRVPRPRPTRAG
jgi:hypothetical protein